MKKNKKSLSLDVPSYLTRVRPFAFQSSVDVVTTVIALLECYLEDCKDYKTSSCLAQRMYYQHVSDFIHALEGSL